MLIAIMRLSIACPTILPGAVGGGLDLVLNKIRARRVGNLTFGLIKSSPNCFQIQRIGGDLIA